MLHTSEEFVRRICETPDDDTARLVYADWLDENGEPERAEFVRLQIEIARLRLTGNPHCTSGSARWCPACGDCTCATPEESLADPGCPLHDPETSAHAELEHAAYLSAREHDLFDPDWLPTFEHRLREWRFDERPLDGEGNPHRFRVQRGFACEWAAPVAEFLRYAEAVFAEQPVTRTTLIEAVPHRATGSFWWYCNDRGEIEAVPHRATGSFWWYCNDRGEPFDPRWPANMPYELFTALPPTDDSGAEVFDTPGAALDWLSERCVAFGRKRAGLPPLP